VYDPQDPTIAAVAWPSRDAEWPCGTSLEICGAAGCIQAIRVDACPGCGYNQVDLSERGIELVCGPDIGTCSVTIRGGRVQ
jgi:hypothetical protein